MSLSTETLALRTRVQMSAPELYVNQPAPTAAAAAAAARYDAAVTPEAVVDAVLAQPDVAAKAAEFDDGSEPRGGVRAQLLAVARYAIDRARPAMIRALDAFGRGEKFFTKRVLGAAATSDRAIRFAFNIVVQVVALAVRVTSPVTTRLAGYALKAAIPAILAAMGIEAVLLPFGLSDPAAKHDVVRVDAAEVARLRAALRDMPLYYYHYNAGAADPDDALRHLGGMAPDFERNGVGDGHRVPLGDVAGWLMAAVQDMDREIVDLHRTVDAMQARLDAAYGAGPDDGGLAARLAAAFPAVPAADWARAAADMQPHGAVHAFGRGPRCVLVDAGGAGWAVVGDRRVRVFRLDAARGATTARLVARFDGAWRAV